MKIVNVVRKEDITYAKVCDSGALPKRSRILRARCRKESITLQLGVISESIRDFQVGSC